MEHVAAPGPPPRATENVCKELVDLQIKNQRLQEQHDAEIFELKSEVLWLESRVLELELQGARAAPAEADPGRRPALAQELGHKAGGQGQSYSRRLQAQSTDFLTPKNKQQELGDGTGVQPPSPKVCQGFSQPGLEVGRKRGPGAWAFIQPAVLCPTAASRGKAGAGASRGSAEGPGDARVLSACRGQLHQAEAENAQLQLQLKKLNEAYAIRLQHCARTVAGYADGAGPKPTAAALRTFLETTLEDIRAAHHSREQQLARAARSYRKCLADLSRRHEELLIAHSVQQMLVDPVGAPGTPRAAFGAAPSDVALLPLHTVTEFSHWMEDQARLEKQLQKLKAQEEQGPQGPDLSRVVDQHLGRCQLSRPPLCLPSRGLEASSWAQIRQNLQEFTRGTQAELERERAQLLVRATMAEEQLSELQEYVDQHLGRYKQEILRLRKLVGTGEPWKVGAIPSDKPQHPRTCSH
ncbi:coiled-coil domain-containing protein 78 isoform X7 [Cervus canadensis]|uniref:coiled-coil domain-containing protein 78 isoform X7 n=1 Tax=Cervus canadensis TaxID=1574408 RepID=UPI001CA33891|nr:coiled-coil domain-containing protein 78 isoform X7 [Cervus canadensis]